MEDPILLAALEDLQRSLKNGEGLLQAAVRREGGLRAEIERLERAVAGLEPYKKETAKLQAEAERRGAELQAEAERAAGLLQAAKAELERLRNRVGELEAAVSSPRPEPPPPAPEAPAETIPGIEPVLEPGWTRVVSYLNKPVAAAYAHLRRLATVRLPDGAKATLRLAAAELAQAQDALKSLAELLSDPEPAAAETRLEAVLEPAVAAWEPAFRQRGCSLARKIEDAALKAAVPPESLRVAVHHLFRNAYEALPRGGRLTIRLWRDAASGDACLSFSDTGPGFGAADLDKLFVPLAAARPGHLGLGLPLARAVLRRCGGEATAAAAAQGGALITLRLPARSDPPETPTL